jgi:hypothetical protein
MDWVAQQAEDVLRIYREGQYTDEEFIDKLEWCCNQGEHLLEAYDAPEAMMMLARPWFLAAPLVIGGHIPGIISRPIWTYVVLPVSGQTMKDTKTEARYDTLPNGSPV